MVILLDNGHGSDTAGKRSPDGRLREYAFARKVVNLMKDKLMDMGYQVYRVCAEDNDVSLTTRCNRANVYCKKYGAKNVLLVSIHCDAAGSDGNWHSAHGWSAFVSRNASSNSKKLASCLIASAQAHNLHVRKYSQLIPYWTKNLAICRDSDCPAVLTENLFQDNREDVDFLLSDDGLNTIVQANVDGIVNYIKLMK